MNFLTEMVCILTRIPKILICHENWILLFFPNILKCKNTFKLERYTKTQRAVSLVTDHCFRVMLTMLTPTGRMLVLNDIRPFQESNSTSVGENDAGDSMKWFL